MKQFSLFVLSVVLIGAYANPATNDEPVEGRGITSFMRNVWDFLFGEDDYEYDYDYYSPSNEEVSSYSFYDPNTARRDHSELADEEEYSWGEVAVVGAIAAAATAAIVSGFLFPPNMFTLAVRRRSYEGNDILDRIEKVHAPFLQALQNSEFLALAKPECQKKLFCELSQLGSLDSASIFHKAFYYVSHLTPDRVSRRLRLQRLFEASRQNECDTFQCPNRENAIHEDVKNHLVAPADILNDEQ